MIRVEDDCSLHHDDGGTSGKNWLDSEYVWSLCNL